MIDRSLIGHELPPSTFAIERGRLRFFARAIGETDPVYTELDAARAAGYPDLPAPPTFLFSAELDSHAAFAMLELLKVPLANVLHGEQGFTWHKPVCAGDTVAVRPRIADIYDKKGGALEFIVKTAEARNQRDELVAELRTVIVYRH